MKKTVFNIISSFIGIALSIGLGFSISSSGKEVIETSAIGDYSTDASTYYQDITATSGTSLAAQLHDLITSSFLNISSLEPSYIIFPLFKTIVLFAYSPTTSIS